MVQAIINRRRAQRAQRAQQSNLLTVINREREKRAEAQAAQDIVDELAAVERRMSEPVHFKPSLIKRLLAPPIYSNVDKPDQAETQRLSAQFAARRREALNELTPEKALDFGLQIDEQGLAVVRSNPEKWFEQLSEPTRERLNAYAATFPTASTGMPTERELELVKSVYKLQSDLGRETWFDGVLASMGADIKKGLVDGLMQPLGLRGVDPKILYGDPNETPPDDQPFLSGEALTQQLKRYGILGTAWGTVQVITGQYAHDVGMVGLSAWSMLGMNAEYKRSYEGNRRAGLGDFDAAKAAYDETDFGPGIKGTAEVVFDPTNFAAVGLVGKAPELLRAVPAAAKGLKSGVKSAYTIIKESDVWQKYGLDRAPLPRGEKTRYKELDSYIAETFFSADEGPVVPPVGGKPAPVGERTILDPAWRFVEDMRSNDEIDTMIGLNRPHAWRRPEVTDPALYRQNDRFDLSDPGSVVSRIIRYVSPADVANTPLDKSLIRAQAARKLWADQTSATTAPIMKYVHDVLEIQPDKSMRAVTPKSSKLQNHVLAFMETPSDKLDEQWSGVTAVQVRAHKLANAIVRELGEAKVAAGVLDRKDLRPNYFMRAFLDRGAWDDARRQTYELRPGFAGERFQQPIEFETISDGIRHGVDYRSDIDKIWQEEVNAVARQAAAKRLKDDLVKEGLFWDIDSIQVEIRRVDKLAKSISVLHGVHRVETYRKHFKRLAESGDPELARLAQEIKDVYTERLKKPAAPAAAATRQAAVLSPDELARLELLRRQSTDWDRTEKVFSRPVDPNSIYSSPLKKPVRPTPAERAEAIKDAADEVEAAQKDLDSAIAEGTSEPEDLDALRETLTSANKDLRAAKRPFSQAKFDKELAEYSKAEQEAKEVLAGVTRRRQELAELEAKATQIPTPAQVTPAPVPTESPGAAFTSRLDAMTERLRLEHGKLSSARESAKVGFRVQGGGIFTNFTPKDEFAAEKLSKLIEGGGLNDILEQGGPIAKFDTANGWLRAVSTTFDLSAMGLQGLPMLFTAPGIWAKGVAASFSSLYDDTVRTKFVLQNLNDVRVAAKEGIQFGATEFTEAVEQASKFNPETRAQKAINKFITKPAVGAITPFNRAFNAWGDVARLELYRALRPTVSDPQDVAAVVDFVNNITGVFDSARIGVMPTQRALEGFLFWSPRYNRAGLALIKATFEGGLRGELARKALFHFAFFGLSAYVATVAALNLTGFEQELKLDPRPVSMGGQGANAFTFEVGGVNFGPGSWWITFARLAAGTLARPVQSKYETWGDFNDMLGGELGAVAKAVRGKTGPLAGTVVDTLSGRTYLGERVENPIDDPLGYMKSLAKYSASDKLLPFIASDILDSGDASLIAKGIILGASIVGARTHPTALYEQQQELEEDLLEQKAAQFGLNEAEVDRKSWLKGDLDLPIEEQGLLGYKKAVEFDPARQALEAEIVRDRHERGTDETELWLQFNDALDVVRDRYDKERNTAAHSFSDPTSPNYMNGPWLRESFAQVADRQAGAMRSLRDDPRFAKLLAERDLKDAMFLKGLPPVGVLKATLPKGATLPPDLERFSGDLAYLRYERDVVGQLDTPVSLGGLLDDNSLEIDWDLADQRLQAIVSWAASLDSRYTVDDISKYVEARRAHRGPNREKLELAAEVRFRDRDELLEDYWQIERRLFDDPDLIAGLHARGIIPKQRAKSAVGGLVLANARRRLALERKRYRLANPDVDAALALWYGYTPLTHAARQKFQQKVEHLTAP